MEQYGWSRQIEMNKKVEASVSITALPLSAIYQRWNSHKYDNISLEHYFSLFNNKLAYLNDVITFVIIILGPMEDNLMLKAKVTTIGNSAGIILPREALGKLKVHKGDFVYLIETSNGYEVVSYDEKFVQQMKVAQKIMREDRTVLKALAECSTEEDKNISK